MDWALLLSNHTFPVVATASMDWANLLSNYAFPFVACVAMAWYVYDRGEKERKDRNENQERHKSEVDNLATVINNNTIVMTKLVDRLGDEKIV